MNIDVLYIHPGSYPTDFNVPTGLIALMNSVRFKKAGIMNFEVTDKILSKSSIIVMDCHWYYPLNEIGRMAKRIKASNPDAKIILGGHTASVFAEEIVRHYNINYVIKGDAEVPFQLLTKSLLEGKDGRGIPNLVTRDFSTPHEFHLTSEIYDRLNHVDIDWFPTLKRRIAQVHRHVPFESPYVEYVGVFPIIAAYKGCKYNCSFCYTDQDLLAEIYQRRLVTRKPQSVKRDLMFCSRSNIIKNIYMIVDFMNLLGDRYASKVFSRKYNLNLYYEFEHFDTPSPSLLKKIAGCFNRCHFTFLFGKPFHRSGRRRFDYLMSVLEELSQSGQDIIVSIYRSRSAHYDKYYEEISRNYEDVLFRYFTPWFLTVPVQRYRNSPTRRAKHFNYWRRKADRDLRKLGKLTERVICEMAATTKFKPEKELGL